MDSRARKSLSGIIDSKDNMFEGKESKGVNISKDGFENYWLYRDVCEEFQIFVNNQIADKDYTLKDLDKFLWKLEDKIENTETNFDGSQEADPSEIEGGEVCGNVADD